MKKPSMSVFEMPVHPAAAMFPMMPEDELDELAADIKTNGLLHPVVIKDDQLVDGRNRREACRRAGVEPQIENLNGLDPVAYILSANINRRNMTKGQRAMAVAKLYPEPERVKRKGSSSLEIKELNGSYISQARTVLAWLPQAADAVLAGSQPLNDAYAKAVLEKSKQLTEVSSLARLRERAPDLADLVDEGRMKLAEAASACETRKEEARRERHVTLELVNGLERMLDTLADGPRRASIVAQLRSQPDDCQRAQDQIKHWIGNLKGTLEALK